MLGYRRIRWRCRPAGTEADHFNCQDEEARNLTTGTPERYESTPGYACRVSNGRDQHLSVISTLIAASTSADLVGSDFGSSICIKVCRSSLYRYRHPRFRD